MKVVIVGAGNMGLAMAQGLKSSGFNITLAGRASPKLQSLSSEFETEIIGDNYDINGKNIFLAIKPNALKWFSNVIIGKANLIISVLARTNLDQIQTLSSAAHAICLPNIAAKNRASINPYMANAQTDNIEHILMVLVRRLNLTLRLNLMLQV